MEESIMDISYLSSSRPVNQYAFHSSIYLWTCQHVPQGRQVDRHGILIMPCSPINTSGPVNPGRQVDRSTGKQVMITHNPLLSYACLWTCQHGRQVDRSTGKQVWNTNKALYSSVDLSTCLPGLTGKEVNIGVQGIMGNPYLFTCRPVNLCTRVDRSRG